MSKVILAAIFCLALFVGRAEAGACELDRPVKIAGMPYESNLIVASIAAEILKRGYDCKAEIEPGESIAMIAALYRGDIDVDLEVWTNSAPDLWHKGIKNGRLVELGGATYSGASEGWWIPEYTRKRYPGLKSVADLPRFRKAFRDPEDPDKGRILSCVPGWVCEVVNINLVKAFGLDDDFNLVTPGSDAALNALVLSEVRRKRDFVTYYWTPTPLIAKAGLVRLGMPPYDPAVHRCNLRSDCETPGKSDFPPTTVGKGAHRDFVKAAPKLAAAIGAVSLDAGLLSGLLSWIDDNDAEPEEGAKKFLAEHPDLWRSWLPAEVADKVGRSL